MIEIGPGSSAADIGSSLTGEDVDRLRQALHWVRSRHGLKVKDLAQNCATDVHTIQNFASGKSNRPSSAFLGRLYCYMRTHQWLLPAGFLGATDDVADAVGSASPKPARRSPSYADVRTVLPLDPADVERVNDRYCWPYLCFSRSYVNPARLLVAWLDVRPVPKTAGDLHPPRFALFIRYPDRVDPGIAYSYVVVGTVVSRDGLVYFVGHHEGGLRYMTLVEPMEAKFTFLQGIALSTSVYDRQPFASRVICRRLDRTARRRDWLDRLGVFTEQEAESLVGNIRPVLRGLGQTAVLNLQD